VLTDFENRRSALIRYAQGDLAAPIRCDCGKIPLPAMTQIVGKVQGVFRTREGRQIIFTHFSPMFRDSPEIGQYQVLQEAFDRFTVRCVPRANADLETLKQRVRQRFEQEFGPDLRIDYEILAEIPRAASGKFHVSICRIAD
jgi:phenylacetate-coenzyme A ligase PaaK-like adenylate-forming protein